MSAAATPVFATLVSRITVHGLVHYRQLGLSDQRLLEGIQGLTQDDLVAAWDYYGSHAAQIEETIRLNEAAIRLNEAA